MLALVFAYSYAAYSWVWSYNIYWFLHWIRFYFYYGENGNLRFMLDCPWFPALPMQILSVLSDLLFSCTILLVDVFLWMSAATFCLRQSAAQLKAFRPQKLHWNNISSEPCCKAGKSVSVINEVPLDSLISKAFYNKMMLFMKKSFVCT